jgi:hypothetical protein
VTQGRGLAVRFPRRRHRCIAVARSFGILKQSTVAYSGRNTDYCLQEVAEVFGDFA